MLTHACFHRLILRCATAQEIEERIRERFDARSQEIYSDIRSRASQEELAVEIRSYDPQDMWLQVGRAWRWLAIAHCLFFVFLSFFLVLLFFFSPTLHPLPLFMNAFMYCSRSDQPLLRP